MPKFQKKIDWKIEKPEWPIAVKCDAHPWMHAYWLVDGPAVLRGHRRRRERSRSTSSRPGDYEVEVWHEELGKKTEKVTIKGSQDTKVAWEMKKG